MNIRFRPIAPQDSAPLHELMLSVLHEFRCMGSEYFSKPEELAHLHRQYESPGHLYLVIEDETGRLLGGGGYARLAGTHEEEGVCEIQKMYFRPELRGRGIGKRLLTELIRRAEADGYQRLYLETMPQMTDAIRLYETFGFEKIPERLGNTGHSSCPVFMARPVSSPRPAPNRT